MLGKGGTRRMAGQGKGRTGRKKAAEPSASKRRKTRADAGKTAPEASPAFKPGHDHPDPYAHLFADEYHREYEAGEEEMLAFYQDMLRIRRFEEKAGQL
ncbi:MAG: hypothetical protein D6740_01775, partial [Alphaproteobacteria bacterium]